MKKLISRPLSLSLFSLLVFVTSHDLISVFYHGANH
ncbi:hypothetical protein QOZ95_003292 [Paenibacillus brasilensis]|uniref:Uncharacterized protein n=1 Tax=Paenibacillus brasilensis TaxID=128574 RepID=A0ABU0L2Z5_9BACL|nr:hypothetical protein [Paenibacillus brasilensis]